MEYATLDKIEMCSVINKKIRVIEYSYKGNNQLRFRDSFFNKLKFLDEVFEFNGEISEVSLFLK